MTNSIKQSILMFGDYDVTGDYESLNAYRLKCTELFANKVLRFRMPGSAALQLAWLAMGRVDISLSLSNLAWDFQGGVLLVREAGGLVYDCNGKEHELDSMYTIASNPHLKSCVLELLPKP